VRRRAAPIGFVSVALLAVAAVLLIGRSPDVKRSPRVERSPSLASATCDLNATPATFASQVSAAASGQTMCLAAGNYGIWQGTSKAITIRPQSGVSPTLSVNLGNGDANFTIDGGHVNDDSGTPGINMGPSTFMQNPGPKNITIENVAITGSAPGGVFEFDGPTNSGIVLDHDVWHDIMDTGTEAAVRFSYSGNSGVTIENSLFRDMVADALKLGAQMKAIHNEFVNVYPHGHSELHTDAIQIFGGTNDVLIGNLVHGNCEQGIGAFDGTSGNTIEDNVVVGCTAHSMALMGDKNPPSLVAHNTIIGSSTAVINCTSKPGEGPSTTRIVDNIASGGIELTDGSDQPCTPSEDTHNMFRSGATGHDFNGIPQFVGGANPSTYAGFKLVPGSAGKKAASDGLDVGARIG
jgi:hypothetical protein